MAEMDVSVYFEAGMEELGAEDYDLAIESFDKAIQLDPNHAPAYANRGMAYFSRSRKKRDADRAIADTKRAMELDPEKIEYLKQLRLILSDVGYGYGFIITGRTLDPGAEIKKRLITLGCAIVVGALIMIIGTNDGTGPLVRGLLGGVLFGIWGIGLIPALVHLKRNILDIPRYFAACFVSGTETFEGGILAIVKSFLFAVILTVVWKPIKLFLILVYLSPFIGIFQMVELLVEVIRNRRK